MGKFQIWYTWFNNYIIDLDTKNSHNVIFIESDTIHADHIVDLKNEVPRVGFSRKSISCNVLLMFKI